MNKTNKKLMILTSAICLLPLLLSAAFYSRLPDQIAIHWNSVGEPDNYASKAFTAFGIPIFLFIIHTISVLRILNDPKHRSHSSFMKYFSIWAVPIASWILIPVTLLIALGADIPVTLIVSLIVGIMFIICGNYLPKSRQNYVIGYKLPWTLHDNDNWNKTHRMAGFLWITAGILLIAETLIFPNNPNSGMLWVAVIILLMILPAGYSFILYKKQ